MSETLRLPQWPACADEFATIQKCSEGYSLARFGDGELKLMHTQGYAREPPSAALAEELRAVLLAPDERCIVGIPTMDPNGPKYSFIEPANNAASGWVRHRPRFLKILESTTVAQYYSAFVTRPDSSPWIKTLTYAKQVEALWKGKRTVVVCEKENSLLGVVHKSAAKTTHIRCQSHQAYSTISRLEDTCAALEPEVVIASAGPTATCLANRLAKRGIQTLDLGSIGGWLRLLLETRGAK